MNEADRNENRNENRKRLFSRPLIDDKAAEKKALIMRLRVENSE